MLIFCRKVALPGTTPGGDAKRAPEREGLAPKKKEKKKKKGGRWKKEEEL